MSSSAVSMKPVVDEGARESEAALVKTHELGTIEGSSENVVVDTIMGNTVNQKMPKTDLGNFLQRPVRIGTYTLASTDTPLSSMASFVPWTLFFANTAVAAKTRDFAYFHGNLIVQCIVTVPAGAYGLYQISACPYGEAPTTGVSVADPNVYQGGQLPHALVDLARAEDVTLKLEWCFPYDYGKITTASVQEQWKIFLYCLRPVGNGSGATSLTATVSVYAWAEEGIDLVVPFQQGKKFLDEKRDKINDKVKKFTGGKKASEVASSIAGIAGTVGSYVPFLAPMAGTIATGASMAASALDWFGFTREAGEKEPTPIIHRPFSNVANMDGIDTGEVAALSVSNSTTIDPRVGGGQPIDEAAFEEIASHWTLVHVAAWNDTDAVGTRVISALPVTPFTAANSIVNSACLTCAGYIGWPFMYWRCDMEYKIVIPVSKFHRGAIQVSWSPELGVAGDISNLQLNEIMEVNADSTMTFTVGFAREVPMLETRFMNASFPTIMPVGLANGTLRFTVVSPLMAQVTTADTSIYVFARGKNLQFGCPKVYDVSYTTIDVPTAVPFFSAWRLQGGALGDDDEEDRVFDLVPPSGDYPAHEICMGETITSARALMQKFTQIRTMTVQTAALGAWEGFLMAHFGWIPMSGSFVTSFAPNAAANAGSNEFTWMGWYQPLFVGIAGSVRYKVINAGTDAVAGNGNIVVAGGPYPWHSGMPLEPSTNNMLSTIAPAWIVPEGNGYECTIPYYHNRTFDCAYNNPTIRAATVNTAQTRVDYMMMKPPNTSDASNTVNCVVYRAGGPDLRLIRFRYTPLVEDSYEDILDSYKTYGI